MPAAASWNGSPSIRGSTESMRMVLLTFSLIGLSFTWSIEMTYCTPYLLQLGLTKSKTSLVWIAGPLSGLIMQPIIGALSDRSTSKWGRRKPFMVGGSIVVGMCLLLLGWTAELVGLFFHEESTKKNVTIITAVFSIYAVDFAINAVQSCCRSLVIDTLPTSQQQLGSAWASRMGACGNVVSYMVGTINLVSIFGRGLGDTQFKKMILISASALLIAVAITSYSVTERTLVASAELTGSKKSAYSILPMLLHRTLHLPTRIQAICWVQFWSWIGWFPFLFYSSTWVGETYYRYEHPPPTPGSQDSHDALGNVGRIGSLALVIFALVTFVSSVILPYLVASSDTPSTSQGKFTPRPPPSLPRTLQNLLVKVSLLQPNLVTSWLISHLMFAAIMFWAPFAKSVSFATLLIALTGVPCAISGWAPMAEIGVEINKLAGGSGDGTRAMLANGAYTGIRPFPADDEEDDDIEMEGAAALGHQQRSRFRATSDTVLRLHHDPEDAPIGSTGELAGVYLGVLNVYTTLPQFVGTFISWVVFSLLEPGEQEEEGVIKDAADPDHHRWLDLKKDAPNAIAVCLFIGACCAVVAAEATRRLKKLG